MNNSQETLTTVRDAYRLIHGYQSALLQIIEKTKQVFDVPNYWLWEASSGRLVTDRKCPIQENGAASFEPLLWSNFYYTSNGHQKPLLPGDRLLWLSHNADTEFAHEDGPIYDLITNEQIRPSSERARSELSIAVAVNLAGSTLSWAEVEDECEVDQIYPTFTAGTTPDGYCAGERPNEVILANPLELESEHRVQVVAAVSSMEELMDERGVDEFLDRLNRRVKALYRPKS